MDEAETEEAQKLNVLLCDEEAQEAQHLRSRMAAPYDSVGNERRPQTLECRQMALPQYPSQYRRQLSQLRPISRALLSGTSGSHFDPRMRSRGGA